ncbi:hypothetical protein J4E90_003099 [Alternaria incomplexa]|uniref:uncharacterized protein n=1 Tax=Alternaria incomplexa TaxID=1187928 RepID=UPI00221E7FD2|nr:uncharacterized protein J4E90_003099 [Alternaria incomplexa]KAI4918712.1 hypothetical protein J4E90_003099 [Alternaria incomplexa]
MASSDKLQRKPSILRMGRKSRPDRLTPSATLRPSTPTSSESPVSRTERRQNGLRRFFGRSREPEVQNRVLTPPSSSLVPAASPLIISRFAKAFVDALNVTQLSNFLIWILYYEVVELPESSKAWYAPIDNMDTRGWVALGEFLAKTQEAGDGYGFDLIVLDSICDRIRLSRPIVHTLLIRFADPEKMKHSILAAAGSILPKHDATTMEALEAAQSKLEDLHKLASHLKPQKGSQYEPWQTIIQERLHAFLDMVVGPRIAHLHTGKPLTTVATSEQLPKEVAEGIRMNYLYEAMQQERHVPLERYGIRQGHNKHEHQTLQSSSSPVNDNEVERSRNHAIALMAENRELRSDIAVLLQDKERLIKANEKLAQKASKLGRLQPAGYIRSPPYDDWPEEISGKEKVDGEQPMATQAPLRPTRPRSVSTGDIEALAAALEQGLNISTHHRQSSEILAQKYDDVFSSLHSSPLPTLRLSALPAPLTPSPSLVNGSATRPMTLGDAPRSGRRSGMIFDGDKMGHLAGGGTPTAEDSDGDGDEDEDRKRSGGYVPVTPTPQGRKRFDLLE